jgi:hypothetical protein
MWRSSPQRSHPANPRLFRQGAALSQSSRRTAHTHLKAVAPIHKTRTALFAWNMSERILTAPKSLCPFCTALAQLRFLLPFLGTRFMRDSAKT